MARRLGLVHNPAARGAVHDALAEAQSIAQAAGWVAVPRATEMRGHGFMLAQELAGDVDIVVAVGGDGTVREVAAGLSGGRTPLAIVPAGTGNSSFKELYGNDPWQQTLAAVLAAPRTRAVDMMEIEPTGELALLGFSAGWFAQIVRLAAAGAGQGPARYVEALGGASANPARFDAKVTVDGAPLAGGEMGLVAVGGARLRASVFPVFPGSLMDDGLLEVLAVHATDSAGFDDLVRAVFEGRHTEHPLAAYRRGMLVEITAPGGLLAEVDGDVWERELYQVTVRCLPGALPVAVSG